VRVRERDQTFQTFIRNFYRLLHYFSFYLYYTHTHTHKYIFPLGDRFWYENGGFESSFTLPQLQQIRHITLARVLCDNLDGIDTLQPFVMLAVDDDR
jgi:hypothetical protein